MPFILPGILVIAFATLAVWWLFFRAVVRHERTVREARRREAEFERLLATPNEPLYCVSCQEVFRGPLDELGCPRCLARAFVIPARTSDDPRVTERVRRLPVPHPVEEEQEQATLDTPVPVRDRVASEEIVSQGNKRI
jgi:hypothetical protein